jgi:hypothetical protein
MRSRLSGRPLSCRTCLSHSSLMLNAAPYRELWSHGLTECLGRARLESAKDSMPLRLEYGFVNKTLGFVANSMPLPITCTTTNTIAAAHDDQTIPASIQWRTSPRSPKSRGDCYGVSATA